MHSRTQTALGNGEKKEIYVRRNPELSESSDSEKVPISQLYGLPWFQGSIVGAEGGKLFNIFLWGGDVLSGFPFGFRGGCNESIIELVSKKCSVAVITAIAVEIDRIDVTIVKLE